VITVAERWRADQREADTGRVSDVVEGGSNKFRRPPPRGLVLLGTGLTVGVLAVAGFLYRGATTETGIAPSAPVTAVTGATATAPCPTSGLTSGEAAARVGAVAALVVDGVGLCAGSTLERRDHTAVNGPWTVVVRRSGGSLGRDGAVVTFPVPAPSDVRTVRVGRVLGTAGSGMLIWPLGGAYARVRGDRTEAELVAIAARTTLVAARPVVHAPSGFVVVSSEPYRSPSIREVRYGSTDLGEEAALGAGLTYTGVSRSGGLEDLLYAVNARSAGMVAGKPAVITSGLGGNGLLAWEPIPGVTAYVGYSGAPLGGDATVALRRLAGRTRALLGSEWQSTHPEPIEQINNPG